MKIATLSLLVSLTLGAAISDASPGFKEKELAEVKRHFKFRGRPIHPQIVHRYAGWQSDSGYPTTVTIDLATASGSGEFPDDEVKVEGNKVVHKVGTDTYAYEWLGVVKSGTHVVLASYSSELPPVEGAETGTSKTRKKVLFLRTAKGKAFLDNGKLYDRLLLTEERRFAVGDNEEVVAKISGDHVGLTLTAAGGKKRTASLDIQ